MTIATIRKQLIVKIHRNSNRKLLHSTPLSLSTSLPVAMPPLSPITDITDVTGSGDSSIVMGAPAQQDGESTHADVSSPEEIKSSSDFLSGDSSLPRAPPRARVGLAAQIGAAPSSSASSGLATGSGLRKQTAPKRAVKAKAYPKQKPTTSPHGDADSSDRSEVLTQHFRIFGQSGSGAEEDAVVTTANGHGTASEDASGSVVSDTPARRPAAAAARRSPSASSARSASAGSTSNPHIKRNPEELKSKRKNNKIASVVKTLPLAAPPGLPLFQQDLEQSMPTDPPSHWTGFPDTPAAATPGYTPPAAATPGYTPPAAATPGYTPPAASKKRNAVPTQCPRRLRRQRRLRRRLCQQLPLRSSLTWRPGPSS